LGMDAATSGSIADDDPQAPPHLTYRHMRSLR
jgi:hypothetical protein